MERNSRSKPKSKFIIFKQNRQEGLNQDLSSSQKLNHAFKSHIPVPKRRFSKDKIAKPVSDDTMEDAFRPVPRASDV